MKSKWVIALAVLVVLPATGGANVHLFPSEDSTVVANGGVLNADELGYFWSVARGDRVVETFADPLVSVNRAIFDFAVPQNFLNSGAMVDWDILINSTLVGDFTISQGFTGPVHLDYLFAPIANAGGQYTVAFFVTNEVPIGAGSHTLAYAGDWPHTVELLGGGAVIPAPGAVLLGSLGAGLVGWLRRRRTL